MCQSLGSQWAPCERVLTAAALLKVGILPGEDRFSEILSDGEHSEVAFAMAKALGFDTGQNWFLLLLTGSGKPDLCLCVDRTLMSPVEVKINADANYHSLNKYCEKCDGEVGYRNVIPGICAFCGRGWQLESYRRELCENQALTSWGLNERLSFVDSKAGVVFFDAKDRDVHQVFSLPSIYGAGKNENVHAPISLGFRFLAQQMNILFPDHPLVEVFNLVHDVSKGVKNTKNQIKTADLQSFTEVLPKQTISTIGRNIGVLKTFNPLMQKKFVGYVEYSKDVDLWVGASYVSVASVDEPGHMPACKIREPFTYVHEDRVYVERKRFYGLETLTVKDLKDIELYMKNMLSQVRNHL